MEVIIVLLVIGGIVYFFTSKSSAAAKQPLRQQTRPPRATDPKPKAATAKPYIQFNLTINIEESVAAAFQAILKNSTTTGYYQAAQDLMPIVARYNVKCQEVDDYVNTYRPIYLADIEAQKKASAEWKNAGELDREDLLEEFRENAILNLDMRPDCDLDVLFSVPEIDLTVDDALIERYEFPIISFYLSKRLGTHIIPANDYERKKFEGLVDAGLAIRGEAVPLESILEKMTLKDMAALVTDLNPPKFSRKIKAIEYLAAVPDIKDRLNKSISFRSIFMLTQLPDEFSNIDLDHVAESWAYAKEFTELICKTYSSMHYQTKSIMENLDPDYNYRKFVIEDAEDCCPYCVKMAKKKYTRNTMPTVPLHIGCSCRLEPDFD